MHKRPTHSRVITRHCDFSLASEEPCCTVCRRRRRRRRFRVNVIRARPVRKCAYNIHADTFALCGDETCRQFGSRRGCDSTCNAAVKETRVFDVRTHHYHLTARSSASSDEGALRLRHRRIAREMRECGTFLIMLSNRRSRRQRHINQTAARPKALPNKPWHVSPPLRVCV